MQVSVRTQPELIAALNDVSANIIIMEAPKWNFTAEELPENAAVLRGRTVILEGKNQPDGSLMYIDGNQLTSRVVMTEGAQLLQRNFWVDDCFISSFPYTCFSFAAGGGSRIEFRDAIFSDATCLRWSESNGITAMVNTAKFVKPLTFKTKEIDERALHVEDTGWVPFVPPTAHWRLVNVTLSCTGNITHELPPDFVVYQVKVWTKTESAVLVTMTCIFGALAWWWMLRKGMFSPPQEVHIARKKGFELMNELGYGRFGKVYRARHRSSSKIVAVKVINLKPTDWKQLRAAWRECQLMSKVKHSSCIKLITYYSARMMPYIKPNASATDNPQAPTPLQQAENDANISPRATEENPSSSSSGGEMRFGIYDVTAALNEFAAKSLSGSKLIAAAEEVLIGRTPFSSKLRRTQILTPDTDELNDFSARHFDSYTATVGDGDGSQKDGTGNAEFDNASRLEGEEEEGGNTRRSAEFDATMNAAGLPLDSLVLQVHLVMEFADQGTLQDRVINGQFKKVSRSSSASSSGAASTGTGYDKKLPNVPYVVDTALDIARGLAMLHSNTHRMVHRDLSPNNVLLISEFNERGFRAVLSDFGLTTVVALGVTHKTSEARGTLAYMPPELLHASVVSTAVDIYSLGILIVFMLSGDEPYQKMNPAHIIAHKLNSGDDQIPIPAFLRSSADPVMFELLKLVKQCTVAERKHRPTDSGGSDCCSPTFSVAVAG